MECPFCEDKRQIGAFNDAITEHLIITLNDGGKFHIHGPIENKQTMKNFIIAAAREAGIEIEEE